MILVPGLKVEHFDNQSLYRGYSSSQLFPVLAFPRTLQFALPCFLNRITQYPDTDAGWPAQVLSNCLHIEVTHREALHQCQQFLRTVL